MENNNIIKAIDSNGIEHEIESIVKVMHNETEKKYILYSDHSKNEEGNLNVYASIYDINEDGIYVLNPIETDEEFELMRSLLDDLQKQVHTEK